jgi:hypothetical protein
VVEHPAEATVEGMLDAVTRREAIDPKPNGKSAATAGLR